MVALIPAAAVLTVAAFAVSHAPFEQPPCGTVRVQVADLPSRVAGLADPAACTITLDPREFNGRLINDVCKITLHEYGHLTGLLHSPDPNSLMYSPYRRIPLPRVCYSRGVA